MLTLFSGLNVGSTQRTVSALWKGRYRTEVGKWSRPVWRCSPYYSRTHTTTRCHTLFPSTCSMALTRSVALKSFARLAFYSYLESFYQLSIIINYYFKGVGFLEYVWNGRSCYWPNFWVVLNTWSDCKSSINTFLTLVSVIIIYIKLAIIYPKN